MGLPEELQRRTKTQSYRAWRAAMRLRCSSCARAGAVDTTKVNLERSDALVAEVADLARLLRSPVLSADDQARALAVLDSAAWDGLAANFLKLVATNRRLFAALDMVQGYRALVAKHKGEATVEVTLANRPSDAQLAAIKDALAT